MRETIKRDEPAAPPTIKEALRQGFTHSATYVRRRMLRANDLKDSGMWELTHKNQGTSWFHSIENKLRPTSDRGEEEAGSVLRCAVEVGTNSTSEGVGGVNL